jgi:hypothetical protein
MEQERLHIEVWDYESFFLNKFVGYCSIPLIDIVDGSMIQFVQCFAYTDGFKPGKLMASINMKISLAEIWDFKLDFMDWKTSSLLNLEDKGKEKKSVNP